jgi:hypothetical protein
MWHCYSATMRSVICYLGKIAVASKDRHVTEIAESSPLDQTSPLDPNLCSPKTSMTSSSTARDPTRTPSPNPPGLHSGN